METGCGAENMEIWVIVIQIAYDLLDTCEIEDEICHICTLHWGYPYAESDFPRCSICWQKWKEKESRPHLGKLRYWVWQKRKRWKQSNAAWEINFMFV